MKDLKKWQNQIEWSVAQNEISRERLFTVMRDKTNELQDIVNRNSKSITKKVDVNNLPTDPVYFFEDDRPKKGLIRNAQGIACDVWGDEVKTYISENDMIELFNK